MTDTVYIFSQYQIPKKHADNGQGKPLCDDKARGIWSQGKGKVTCKKCLAALDEKRRNDND